MTEEMRRGLLDAGIQVEEALDRFLGNEALLTRFLKKFPQDQNYETLCRSLEAGDLESAFRAAHTLKGVCGNLSLERLTPLVSGQTELLRLGDLTGAAELLPRVIREHDAVCAAIRQYLAE